MPFKSDLPRTFVCHHVYLAILWSVCFGAHLFAAQTSKPEFNFPAGKYRQPIQITLQSATPHSQIYYTLDGSRPDSTSIRYTAPILIFTHAVGDSVTLTADNDPDPLDENPPITWFSKTIRAVAIAAGLEPSPVVRADYVLDLVDGYFNIPYADPPPAGGAKHWLDIYQPHGYANTPVLLFIHGGAWRQGDKNIYMELGNTFAGDYHFTTVVANYQLSTEPWNAIHPTHIQDVALAFAWVAAHIHEYGGDSQQLYLFGQSAGAHLVSLLATDATYLQAHGLGLDHIRGVISMSGAYQLSDLVAWPLNPIGLNAAEVLAYKALCENTFGSWEESVVDAASPAEFISKNQPPFLIISLNETGEFLDMPGFSLQAAQFYQKMLTLNLPAAHQSLNASDIPAGILALDFPGEIEGHYEEIYAINTQYWDCLSAKMVAAVLPDLPEIPIVVALAQNNENLVAPVLLKWFRTPDATQYLVEMATDSNFLNLISFSSQVVVDTLVAPDVQWQENVSYYWRVRAQNPAGNSAWSLAGQFRVTNAAAIHSTPEAKWQPDLLQLFPNPFNGALQIKIQNANPQIHQGKLEIFDISGRRIHAAQLNLNPGLNQWRWRPTPELQSGVYLLRLAVGPRRISQRVIYLK